MKSYCQCFAVLLVLSATLLPTKALAAEYVVSDAIVIAVATTTGNAQAFQITVSGGSGTCAGGQIVLNQSDSPDADTFKRAYAAAPLALTTKAPVAIYNYQDNTCNHASLVVLGFT